MTAVASVAPASSNTVAGLGWLQRKAPVQYNKMEGLLEFLRERSKNTVERNVKNRDFTLAHIDQPETMDDANKLAVVLDGKPYEMTHYSFTQLCGLAKAPSAFMRDLPAMLVANNLDYMLKHKRDSEAVKIFRDGNELRAINGTGYGRIHDHEIVNAMGRILDDGRWQAAEKHMGLRATDRSLQMFLIDKTRPVVVGKTARGDDDVLYRGLRISNSEVGFASLAVDGFLFRGYCLNGMIFGMKDQSRFTIRHSVKAPMRWAREIQPAIMEYANTDGQRLVEAVEAVKAREVAKTDEGALAFLKKLGLNIGQQKEALERSLKEEDRPIRTAWDAIQAVTAVARDISGTEERADMERLAGSIWSTTTRKFAA